jgi:hypothetical protein
MLDLRIIVGTTTPKNDNNAWLGRAVNLVIERMHRGVARA